MGQWYEQPEEDEPRLFSARNSKGQWVKENAVRWLVVLVVLMAAVIALTILAGCVTERPWRASLRIEYANGQRITSAESNSPDWRTPGTNSIPAK